jgi:hypothetical protein
MDGGEPYRVGVEVQVTHAKDGLAAMQALQKAGMPMAAAGHVSQEELMDLMGDEMGALGKSLKRLMGSKKKGSDSP